MDSVAVLEQDLHRWYKTFKAQLTRQEKHGEGTSCLTCGKKATDPEGDKRGATICSFFQAGNCARGAKCKFVHGTEVPQQAAPTEPVTPVTLTKCEACEAVVFCSPECQTTAEAGPTESDPLGLKSHTELDCHELQLFAGAKDIIDEEEMEKGEPQWLAYSDLDKFFLEYPGEGWSHYAELRNMPTFSPPFMALVTDALSFPLTVVHGIGRLLSSPNPSCLSSLVLLKEGLSGNLRIHLLGAEWDSEGTGEDKWMEILHLLPAVQSLELILVGPSLPDECHQTTQEMCAMLGEEKEGRPYSLKYWKGTYEAFMHESDYSSPHLAVAFHSGLADFREEWRPAITPLVNRGIPLLFTHYHRHEAEFDCRTLRCHFQAHIVGDNFAPNPYQSLLPIPDVFEGRVYYCNHFITLAWGRMSDSESGKKRLGESVEPKVNKKVKVISTSKPKSKPKKVKAKPKKVKAKGANAPA